MENGRWKMKDGKWKMKKSYDEGTGVCGEIPLFVRDDRSLFVAGYKLKERCAGCKMRITG